MPPIHERRETVRAAIREHGSKIASELSVNVLGPLFLYYTVIEYRGAIAATIVAAIPPLAANGLGYARTRRVDALSVFAVLSILSPLLTMIAGGSGQALQLHQKLPLLLFGLAFLGSAAIGKPLIFPLARATVARESAAALARFEARLDDLHLVRTMMVMTLVWGLALVIEFSANAVLIYGVSLRVYMTVGPILGYAASAALLGWTIAYRRTRRREPSLLGAA
jgi:hypothetical protein